MDIAPLLLAKQPIPLHAIAALLALCLGVVQLALKKGTTLHRRLGYCWCGLMAVVALSGFFIHEIRIFGPLSPIHLLSILTLWTLYVGIQSARRQQINRHRLTMAALFFLGLVLTGAFTFFPGRVMHAVLATGS